MSRLTARLLLTVLASLTTASLVAGCVTQPAPAFPGGESLSAASPSGQTQQAGRTGQAPASRADTFILGDTTFNPENEEPDVNPHHAYSGWAAVRYGLAETLFRYTDSMGLEPWLAQDAHRLDERTWTITLRTGITFADGRVMDAIAVKDCLEELVAVHARAAADLSLESIQADGHQLTVRTTQPVPTFLTHLADPYAAIVDVDAPVSQELAVGTGPYRAVRVVSGQQLDAVANPTYWAGTPGFAALKVMTIVDGDTLMLALRSGQVDGAYGLPYSTYPALVGYRFSQALTSRTFILTVNMDSPIMADPAVRCALAAGIDKDGFVRVLGGNGRAASGPFPPALALGNDAAARSRSASPSSVAGLGGSEIAGPDPAGAVCGKAGVVRGKTGASDGVGEAAGQVRAPDHDPAAAAAALEHAGWKDQDGDGVREKDGHELAITWLTYPSRQELPLLAEWAQASLEAIGFRVRIDSTSEHTQRRKDPAAWDVYASAMVTDPTGDPAYFFTTRAVGQAVANYGHYRSQRLDWLAGQLARTYEPAEREQLGIQMAQQVVDDGAFIFITHLTMSLVTAPDVTGFHAHPSDVYEVTANLRREEGR